MGQNPGTPGEHQNSWDLWMFIPLKMVSIGIDPYPCLSLAFGHGLLSGIAGFHLAEKTCALMP